MISAEQNDLITRVGPGTPAGKLLRRYWQPVALAEELAGPRPVAGREAHGPGLRPVPRREGPAGHAGPRLPAPRRRPGLRPHRGRRPALPRSTAGCSTSRAPAWKRQPSPPAASCAAHQAVGLSGGREERHHLRVHRRRRAAGFPRLRLLRRARAPTFAFKGLFECNWLQALEVGIDPRTLVPAPLLRGRGAPRRATASSSAAPRPTPTCPSPRCCASSTARDQRRRPPTTASA